jgi:hypothetical protein
VFFCFLLHYCSYDLYYVGFLIKRCIAGKPGDAAIGNIGDKYGQVYLGKSFIIMISVNSDRCFYGDSNLPNESAG